MFSLCPNNFLQSSTSPNHLCRWIEYAKLPPRMFMFMVFCVEPVPSHTLCIVHNVSQHRLMSFQYPDQDKANTRVNKMDKINGQQL